MEENVQTGRRKTAVATVWLRPGSGKVTVNGREFSEYFPVEIQRQTALNPLAMIKATSNYDLVVKVKGGGVNAQAEAFRLALSRALVSEKEELRHDLKAAGFLTRDPRMKERKKYGLAGARKRFQFSKR